MAFSKTIFVDNQTVIDADTLNAIQDELIRVGGLLGKDIQSAAINDSGHLILTLTDGTTLDAGVAKGAQGPQGATGPAGTDGKSAYQYAVENGYTGTEEEFAKRMAAEIPAVDTTLTQSGKAADAKAVGDALAALENKIPTASGGMSVTAADLLVTILRNAEYSTDQSDNITALATALNATPEPDKPIVVRYAITNNLTECVNSNAATSLTEGASYTATLTASDGFVLDAVTVMMGGVDVTATVYVDGTITIPSVTGDVIITAVAVAVEEVLPFENGKTYTSAETGYTEGYFVNGDGSLTENAGFAYVEFPCRGASRIILNKNAYEGNSGVIYVDAEKNWVANGKMTSVTADDGTKTFDAYVPRNVEYARIMARKGGMPNLTITPIQDPMWDGTYEIGKWYRMPYKDGCQFNPSTGVVTEGGGSSCATDFMSIYGVTSGEIRNNYVRSFVMFYDSDKNYISNVVVQNATTFTVPEGAMWMRYGVNMENVNFVIKVTA